MSITVKTEHTLFRPVTIGLRSTERGDYKARTALGSRLDWEPMAGCVDWAAVEGLDEFHVRLRYAEYEETRKESEYASYNGRQDFRRKAGGDTFSRTICKVRIGDGSHAVIVRNADHSVYKRIVPKDQVMGIVRLFTSTQYVRRALDIRIGGDAPTEPTRMIVRPTLERNDYDDCS